MITDAITSMLKSYPSAPGRILARILCFLSSTLLVCAFSHADGTIDLKLTPASTTTISAQGSYRVVDDVTMNSGISAITITGNNITLDLGGHLITGGGGSPVDGISGSSQTSVTIFDGTITGFSQYGISLGDRARIRNVEVRACAAGGISTGTDSTVEKCRAVGNNSAGGYAGIQVGGDSMVRECTASGNNPSGALQTSGIYLAGSGCRAEGNVCENNVSPGGNVFGIYGNASGESIVHNVCRGNQSTSGAGDAWGIKAPFNSALIRDNVCEYNTSAGKISGGISAANACVIENNVCSNNSANSSNTAYGIFAGNGCTIRGNTCWSNNNTNNGSAYGINATTGCTVEGNSCYQNTEGPNANSLAIGIYANSWCIVVHNSCGQNAASGADGYAYGIYAGPCFVRDNTCDGQTGAGSGYAAGIFAFGNCKVTENHCTSNTGGLFSYGIRTSGSGLLIAGNFTEGNGTAGLIFGTGTTNNRSRSNEFRETTGIDLVNGIAPASPGTGDLADVTY